MDIYVNIPILTRKGGDVVTPRDKDYNVFNVWATNKDRKFGQLICEHKESKKEQENTLLDMSSDKALTCDICGYEAKSSHALSLHKTKTHKG
jgi:hypothetical protein